MRPLHFAETFGHEGVGLVRGIDHDGQNERHPVRDTLRPLGGDVPLDAKIPFEAGLGRGRNHREEKHTLLDLAANLRVPLVALLEAAFLIEPHFDAGGAQGITDATSHLPILRGIAHEDGATGG